MGIRRFPRTADRGQEGCGVARAPGGTLIPQQHNDPVPGVPLPPTSQADALEQRGSGTTKSYRNPPTHS